MGAYLTLDVVFVEVLEVILRELKRNREQNVEGVKDLAVQGLQPRLDPRKFDGCF